MSNVSHGPAEAVFAHVTPDSHTHQNRGFTLAEVLITLVIIGIIAAITIPSLISKYREQALEVRYLKAKSTIANAMRLLAIESGSTDLRLSTLMNCYNYSGNQQATCLQAITKKIFRINNDSINNISLLTKLNEKYYSTAYIFDIMPQAFASANGESPWETVPYAFITSDGMIMGYDDTIYSDGSNDIFYMVVDVNSLNNPNKMYSDLFRFAVNSTGKVIDRTCEYNSTCDTEISASEEDDDEGDDEIILPVTCFIAGSKVLMADGTQKNIEEVKSGDRVVSYDVQNKKFYNTNVKKLFKHTIKDAYYEIVLRDGTKINPTNNHPILTDEGFKTILIWDKYPELKVGDKVQTINGYSEIVSIDKIKVSKRTPVFNIDVRDDNETDDDDTNDNYIINGVVSHNKIDDPLIINFDDFLP